MYCAAYPRSWSASLASSEVTLAAGVYLIRVRKAFSSGAAASNTRARIWNATDSAAVALGEGVRVASTDGCALSEAVGVVTITTSKAFRLEFWAPSNVGDLGLGVAVSTVVS